MFANPLRSSLAAGETVVGAFCGIPDPAAAELVAAAGFDYVCVDMQHGLVDFGILPSMLAAIGGRGSIPLVRVPVNEPWMIMKAADAGALGIVTPLVNTADEAARAVAACRYPPIGNRSFGPVRASLVVESREPRELDDIVCIVMTETVEALRNIGEITATPGVDVVYVGPVDLALALGLPPGYTRPEPEHADAIERIVQVSQAAGVWSGIQCDSGAAAARWQRLGFQMTTIGSDHAWLRAASSAARAEALQDISHDGGERPDRIQQLHGGR